MNYGYIISDVSSDILDIILHDLPTISSVDSLFINPNQGLRWTPCCFIALISYQVGYFALN